MCKSLSYSHPAKYLQIFWSGRADLLHSLENLSVRTGMLLPNLNASWVYVSNNLPLIVSLENVVCTPSDEAVRLASDRSDVLTIAATGYYQLRKISAGH
jgi:hypothetical protein